MYKITERWETSLRFAIKSSLGKRGPAGADGGNAYVRHRSTHIRPRCARPPSPKGKAFLFFRLNDLHRLDGLDLQHRGDEGNGRKGKDKQAVCKRYLWHKHKEIKV